ncbi:MAG: hypothetical protein AAF730_00695 [Bacteroidota bacterium]
MLDVFAPRDPESALRHLHKVLGLGGVGPWVFIPLFFLSFTVGFFLMKAAVVLVLPYLGWLLWQAEWKGWLTALPIVSALPMLFFWSGSPVSTVAGLVLDVVPLIATLCYTSLLQQTIADWLHDQERQHRFEQDDLEHASPQAGTPA